MCLNSFVPVTDQVLLALGMLCAKSVCICKAVTLQHEPVPAVGDCCLVFYGIGCSVQGDKEKALGMSVSPLMDRKNKGGITRSQVHLQLLIADRLMHAAKHLMLAATLQMCCNRLCIETL